MSDVMAGLRARFRARCAGDLGRLRQLMEQGALDAAEARTLVHGLAGTGATFGFPDVSVAARPLDDALADGRTLSPTDFAALIAALEAAVTEPS